MWDGGGAQFFIIFVIFAVMGMMMFGTSLEEWSAFTSAFQTLIMMLTVEYGMEGLIGEFAAANGSGMSPCEA
jgi:hypothetical protein